MDWQPLVFVAIVVPIVVYSITWIKNKLGPNEKLAMQNEPPLLNLKKVGFAATTGIDTGDGSEPDKAVGYVGQVEGYAVEIAYNFLDGVLTKHPYFRVRVFFNPGNTEPVALAARLAQDISRSKMFRWSDTEKLTETYAETALLVGRFGPPSTQALLEAAQRLVRELKSLNLPPIAYAAGISLTKK